jgi:hypothetical protein
VKSKKDKTRASTNSKLLATYRWRIKMKLKR